MRSGSPSTRTRSRSTSAAKHVVRDPRSGRRPPRRAASGATRCAPSAAIITDAIRSRDDAAAQAELAGEVREIVDRFPVPGLPAA